MKIVVAMMAGTTIAVGIAGGTGRARAPDSTVRGIPPSALTAVVEQYCQSCHNAKSLKGNLSLEGYKVDSAYEKLEQSEKMIRKLRAEIMPPPGARRPAGDTLLALVETLEKVIDDHSRPNPGTRTFQRLNRPEYEAAVRDLLGVQIQAGDFLPLDTKSANFDNIADVQVLSPTLLEAYLNAAAAVSRTAVGDRNAPTTMSVYKASPFASQHPWDHVEGAPFGSRGGIVALNDFPADGQYTFRVNVEGGVGTRLEDVDLSIDGARVALMRYERGVERTFASADAPSGADYLRTEPIFVRAGQHRVAAAFVRRTDGPYEDLIKPHDWSLAANGTASAGTTEPPHLMELAVLGPKNITGISETPSRKLVFTCRPTSRAQETCASSIIARLGAKAYRRPLTPHDRQGLTGFYRMGAKSGGFEEGVRTALQAMLASPYFVFRIEPAPPKVADGQDYLIGDNELATRLSFFLWGSIPDDELLTLARQHRLSDKKTLALQVKRMLADPRTADALATRFASQWLRLQDLEKVRPDAFWFPDFDQQLADAMRRETELFFGDLVRNDKSVIDLFTANYTFVNERLAKHYGIPNVTGTQFQRVTYPDSTRQGLLGHGSMLVQTSFANRTSPVLRGKWVMEVLIGMPPPPPPPDVPTLDETAESKGGRLLTTRERMEIHRRNATCRACHQYMDPIGLALDNFDVTGKWRYRENGVPLDTRGQMYDGSDVTSPADLKRALLKRPIPLVRSFTENLMAYALGRRVEDYDQPTIRALVKDAEPSGYKISSLILGVVNSSAFRGKRADGVADSPEGRQR